LGLSEPRWFFALRRWTKQILCIAGAIVGGFLLGMGVRLRQQAYDEHLARMLDKGLPDGQRTLNWVHLASRYPVRVRVQDPSPELFRVGEPAVVTIRGN
jgi:hypothetical protein